MAGQQSVYEWVIVLAVFLMWSFKIPFDGIA
jgi:hypothetical protein